MAEPGKETAASKAPDLNESDIYDIAIRLTLLGLFIYFSLKLIEPFLMILLWAIILTVALFPVHQWLKSNLGGSSRLASTLITLAGLAIILGPIAALGLSLAESLQWMVGQLNAGTLTIPPPPDGVREWPIIGERAHAIWTAASDNLQGLLQSNSKAVLSTGASVLGKIAGVGGGVLIFAVSIIVAGLLFGPGEKLADTGRKLAGRIFNERGVAFVDMAGATIRNVSRGVIGVAVLQTLLAGIGLIVAGVPAAGVLCFVILILCIIQVGPGVILIPVMIWGWNTMETLPALLLTAYMVPVMILDNFLKPIMMSKGLETPMLVILIGVIGGSLGYGLVGLFVGPVVLGVFYDIVRAWMLGATPEEMTSTKPET